MMLQQLSFGGVRAVSFCNRCGKPLSNPLSVQAGMGPICRGHNNQKERGEMRTTEFADKSDFSKPLGEALVLRREVVGHYEGSPVYGIFTNVPHLVAHHSPSGFEFGYAGSGPADLALNVCEWYLKHTGYEGRKTECWDGECFELAYAMHQDFKNEFIATASHEGCEISFATIDAWFKERIADDVKDTYALMGWEEEVE